MKESINQAVKEVVNDLRSFDMFSLSFSKARMEMPHIDASIHVFQFHEVIEEMKIINPTCEVGSVKERQMWCDVKNNPRHHKLDGHKSRKMHHSSREI